MAGITPWYVGQLAPGWLITLEDDLGNPIDLTNATSVELTFKSNSAAGGSYVGQGAAGFGSPRTSGQITYLPSAADVAAAGSYSIFVTVTFSVGPSPYVSDPLSWQLLPTT